MEIQLNAVLIGRILGGVVIFFALLSAIAGAVEASSGAFDMFLYRLAVPLALGCLIIAVTELVRVLDTGKNEETSANGDD